jgi:hypothetical protein
MAPTVMTRYTPTEGPLNRLIVYFCRTNTGESSDVRVVRGGQSTTCYYNNLTVKKSRRVNPEPPGEQKRRIDGKGHNTEVI